MVGNPLFDSLDVPVDDSLTQSMINSWVVPVYMELNQGDVDAVAEVFIRLWPEMSQEVVEQLLRARNWRPRIVGSYLAALREFRPLTNWIGRLLLRSDVCYAGMGYCVALTRFNTAEAIEYLIAYLGHYLLYRDLWFDQAQAMAAIAYLDRRNGTENLASLMPKWEAFVADKPNWNLASSISRFTSQMERLDSLAARCAAGR